MARTELETLIVHTRQLVSDADESTWSSSQNIIDALDQHSVFIDWTPMRHGVDYHTYETKAREQGSMREALAGVRDINPVRVEVPDFGTFYRVGFFDTNWIIRDDPSESGAPQTPDGSNPVGGSFLFSTAPNRELYLQGTAHNPYLAAADLLLESPDTGREVDTARMRGQVSRSIELKHELYAQRGYFLNRRRAKWTRA